MWAKALAAAVAAVVVMLAKKATETAMAIAPGLFGRMRNWWNGKSIAVIGPTASGKNSMFQKMKNEEAPKIHIQTRGAERVQNFAFSWPLPDRSSIEFQCRRSINVGGEIDERERNWRSSCEDADVIFYLIDAQKLTADASATVDRIADDLRWMSENFRHFRQQSCVHILVNKVDVFTANVPLDSKQSCISEKLVGEISKIEELSKKILGSFFGRISGISPISMIDDHLFGIYFTAALQSVFASADATK